MYKNSTSIPSQNSGEEKISNLDLYAVLSAVGDAVTIQDTDFKIIYQNESCVALLGRHLGERCYEAYEGNSQVCESCQLKMCFEDGKVHRIEREVSTGKGIKYFDITASSLLDSEGRVIAGIEVVRDVTERHKLRVASGKTAETLRSLVEASPLAIIALDFDGVVTLWNPAAERIFGWEEKEVKGTTCPFITEDNKEKFESFLNMVRNGESITGVNVQRKKKDGSPVDLTLAISPLRDEAGHITAMMCVLEDITDRVKMEERITQSERDWEDVFNQITEMITIHDNDYNIIRANKAAESILGLPPLEGNGSKCFEYYHGKTCAPEKCPSCASLKTLQPGTWEFFEPHLKKFLEISAIPRFDADNKSIGLIHIGRDITQKKRLESIANAATLMDSIGYVFSGVRHEIGNPVNTAKLLLSVLKEKFSTSSPEEVKNKLGIALEQLDRVEFLLKTFRNFNMYEEMELDELPVSDFMEKFQSLVGRDFAGRGIEITLDIAPEVRNMIADPRAMQQVLLNVFSNAADALSGIEKPRIAVWVRALDTMVFIVIEDNGRGIPEAEKKNLFKPFYTTKPKGTGLGLVIIKNMMTKMNGDVDIKSVEGQGTTVSLILPACVPQKS